MDYTEHGGVWIDFTVSNPEIARIRTKGKVLRAEGSGALERGVEGR